MITLRKRMIYTSDRVTKRLTPKELRETTMIKMYPKDASQDSDPAVLVALLHREQRSRGLSMLNPALSIGRVLRQDSSILRVVEAGDVRKFRELLTEKMASLHDRTETGAPLLHVWLHGLAPIDHLLMRSSLQCNNHKCVLSWSKMVLTSTSWLAMTMT